MSPVLVSGWLTVGSTSLAGVPVAVVAWPPDHVLEALGPGAVGALPVVARGVTGPDGSFRIAGGGGLAAHASKGGSVNLQVVTPAPGGRLAVWSFSRELDSKGRLRPAQQVADAVAPQLRLAASPAEVRAYVASRRDEWIGGWYFTWIRDYPSSWVRVGQAYVTTPNASAVFTYTQGANSQLGVAVSAKGEYGTFTVGGSATHSSSASVTFDPARSTTGHVFETMFTNSLFSVHACLPISCRNVLRYEARTTQFAGGSRLTVAPVPSTPWNHCVPYTGGSHTKDRTTAVEWSAGYQVQRLLGIDLSARTGYSTTASVTFFFSSGKTVRLCGTHGQPGWTSPPPRQLVARP